MNLNEEHKKIYDEIIQLALDKKRASSEEDWKIIDAEIQKLADTDGIKGWNNLDKFYNIIQTNLGQSKKHEKNEIHSWTAYFIGLTDLKPENDFAPLRRVFARDGFPDIDTDFDDQCRDLVQEYLVEKYGTEYVANIAAHQTLKLRDTLTRVIKALDIADAYNDPNKDYVSANAAKVVEIMDTLPSLKGQAKMMANTPDGQVEIKTIEDAYEHCEGFRYYMDQYPQIMEHVKNIQGLASSFSCVAKDTPILTKDGWVRIDQLSPDEDFIAYISNNEKVLYTNKYKSIKTGNKKLYRMKLSNGDFVDITDEHLVFTDKGVFHFKKIRENKKLYKIANIRKGFAEE